MVTVEGVNPETINVMSQYNAQCTALRVELKEKGFDKFKVTTVVSSQGIVNFYSCLKITLYIQIKKSGSYCVILVRQFFI